MSQYPPTHFSFNNQQQPHHSSQFNEIYEQLISTLQQRLNYQCAQHDSLMPLLSIGNFFQTLPSYQPHLQSFSKKLDKCFTKLSQFEKKNEKLDRNFWQRSVQQIKLVLANNQIQLKQVTYKYEELERERVRRAEATQYQRQQQAKQLLTLFQQNVHTELATQSNLIHSRLLSSRQSEYISEKQLIQKRLQKKYQPLYTGLEDVEEQIEVYKILLPQRNLYKFYQFNYNRMKYELMELGFLLDTAIENNISKTISKPSVPKKQGIRSSHKKSEISQTQPQQLSLSLSIQKYSQQLQAIRYQLCGTKQKFLRQFSLNINLYMSTPQGYDPDKLSTSISEGIQELQQLLNKIDEKMNKLKIIKEKQP